MNFQKNAKILIEAGRGRKRGDKMGAGPNGFCICPKCGNKEKHITGQPCFKQVCKKCGTKMTRK
jgi:tRNA G26 N,N-dimethylase Trm1